MTRNPGELNVEVKWPILHSHEEDGFVQGSSSSGPLPISMKSGLSLHHCHLLIACVYTLAVQPALPVSLGVLTNSSAPPGTSPRRRSTSVPIKFEQHWSGFSAKPRCTSWVRQHYFMVKHCIKILWQVTLACFSKLTTGLITAINLFQYSFLART